MRVQNVSDPIYAARFKGNPYADSECYPEETTWPIDGQMVRQTYMLHPEEDDFS